MAYLKELPFFQGILEEKLYQVARAAKLRTYFENDQIMMNHDYGQMFFLLEGRVARLMDPGSGWYSMLDVAKEGKILNETVMMERCKSSVMGEVLSEKARILIVPLPQLMDLALGSNSFRKHITLHILGEMEKYQRRWVSS
jgi:signal-transduction protein with cAMP-binding, CBS, and nucleotidyltransferase domain